MSRENVEAIRSIYERWGAGDFQAGVELFDPNIVFIMRPEFPDSGTYLGIEGVAEYMRNFLEPWSRITIEAKEIVAAGDSVIVAVSQVGVGSGSGAVTEFRYFHVWSFQGGRVIRFETMRERAEAMEAVGALSDG